MAALRPARCPIGEALEVTSRGTISVVMARPAVAALEQRGIDPGPVLRAVRISREALDVIEHRLAATHVRALWEEAAAAAGDAAFGVHVGEAIATGMFDIVEYIFATSADLGSGLRRLTTYIRLLEDPDELRLVVEPLVARVVRHGALATAQFDEFAMTVLVVRSREATATRWAPDRIRFQHQRAGDLGEVARVFACPVSFGAPHTELELSLALLDLRFERRDSRLLAILERYAETLLHALPPHGSIAARASHAIALALAREVPDLGDTAAALQMAPRTLQRHLAELGASHSILVDEVRRGLALQHIGDASLSITQIAYMLHFADPSAFYRAFRRWTGRSPRAYRLELLTDGTPRMAREE